MESTLAEIKITYGNTSKIMIYQKGTSLDQFKAEIARGFNLSLSQFNLYDSERNAEIIHAFSLQDGRAFQVLEGGNLNGSYVDDNREGESENTKVINLDTLKGKIFENESLIDELNKWALKFKFQVMVSEGLKKMKSSFKKSFRCQIRTCPYRIIYLSDENCEKLQVYEKLSEKYKSHSKFMIYVELP